LQLIALSTKFSLVGLEEEIVLVDARFDAIEVADVLVFEELVLAHSDLLESQDEFFAVADDIVGEVCPLELRFVEHLLAVSFFLLEDHHILLHHLQAV